ncbi:DUF2567 domain-containing protein [Cryptosporangium phraense]|uniref:DUF2567 domain-containing protein n=1 Tax=Cryptosporangium phraense TaxID=2593070 RepID=A0A545ALT0_9ACTN|nr:DUF2567 domain-containing protein [Cryptosporangium phraense]TQS41685.1 DUF2567 domain-containing protein [Cryptosporangium phraense]
MRHESPGPDGVTTPRPAAGLSHSTELVPVRRRHAGEEPEDPPGLSPAALMTGIRASTAWRDVIAAVVLALVVAASGAINGVLWGTIGPHVPVLMTANGPILAEYYGESSFGAQATYGGLALAAGLLLGPIAYLARRWRGPIVLVGLAAGCLAAGFVSWKLGTWWGRDEYDSLLQHAAPGRQFPMPVELNAKGLLFLEPLMAVLGYVVVAAWSRYPDLKVDPGLNREHGRHWGDRPPDQ